MRSSQRLLRLCVLACMLLAAMPALFSAADDSTADPASVSVSSTAAGEPIDTTTTSSSEPKSDSDSELTAATGDDGVIHAAPRDEPGTLAAANGTAALTPAEAPAEPSQSLTGAADSGENPDDGDDVSAPGDDDGDKPPAAAPATAPATTVGDDAESANSSDDGEEPDQPPNDDDGSDEGDATPKPVAVGDEDGVSHSARRVCVCDNGWSDNDCSIAGTVHDGTVAETGSNLSTADSPSSFLSTLFWMVVIVVGAERAYWLYRKKCMHNGQSTDGFSRIDTVEDQFDVEEFDDQP